jgi:DamX protein
MRHTCEKSLPLVLAAALLLPLAGCTTTGNVILKDTVKTYPVTESVEILRATPTRSYERLATVEAIGATSKAVGSDHLDLLRDIGEKAKSIGADAVVITEERANVDRKELTYSLKGIAIKYSTMETPIGPGPGAAPPAVESRAVTAARGTANWIASQNPEHYTIQLVATRSEMAVSRFIEEHNLGGNTGYFTHQQDGATWYTLVYGSYPSRDAAKSAIATLPPTLRKASPWVRKFGDIQQLAGR